MLVYAADTDIAVTLEMLIYLYADAAAFVMLMVYADDNDPIRII